MESMNFKYEKRGHNSFLNIKKKYIYIQPSYLKKLKQFKEIKHQIYYLDKIWINTGYIKNFVFDKILI